MGVVRYGGAGSHRFSVVAAALGNASANGCTVAVVHRLLNLSGFKAMGYLTTPLFSTAEMGMSVSDNNLFCDASAGPGGGGVGPPFAAAEPYLSVMTHASTVSAAIRFHQYRKSTDAWATPVDRTGGDQGAGASLELGAWVGGDFYNGWIALMAIWAGIMSDTHVQALKTNWRTSDFWLSAHGTPVCLIEGNTLSLVDLAGNATSLATNGTAPTLDGAETMSSFNFDGIGAAPQILRPDGDLATTGWAATPLHSKLSDQSDATVITATLS